MCRKERFPGRVSFFNINVKFLKRGIFRDDLAVRMELRQPAREFWNPDLRDERGEKNGTHLQPSNHDIDSRERRDNRRIRDHREFRPCLRPCLFHRRLPASRNSFQRLP